MPTEAPSSASPRSTVHQRTSSSNSTGKAATTTGGGGGGGGTGGRAKTGKTHAVGKHNRNTSYGRNLNKLGMARMTAAAGEEQQPARLQRARSTYTPSGSPEARSAGNVRRNKSEVALPSRGSKVHLKKNQSAVALRRNESASRLKRLSRPTTPRESKEDEESQLKGHAQPAFGFGSDEEEEDEDEWTEESASQSPTITRTGSMKGPKPTLPIISSEQRQPSVDLSAARGDSPTTPLAQPPPPILPTKSPQPHQPDPEMITKKLLTRSSAGQLAPKLSTISAGGSSGAQTPAEGEPNGASLLASQISFPTTTSSSTHQASRTRDPAFATGLTPKEPSLGKDGVSRFLDPHAAASSSGRSAIDMHNGMAMIRQQSSNSRSESPQPISTSAPAGEAVRRAKSAIDFAVSRDGYSSSTAAMARADSRRSNHNLERRDSARSTGTGYHSRQGSLDADDQRAWTVTIDPQNHRRAGGRVQARQNLIRTQVQAADAEPAASAPPAPLMQKMHGGATASSYLGVEERRVRMADEAESQLNFLRMFRSPMAESAERVRKMRKKREREEQAHGSSPSRGRANGYGQGQVGKRGGGGKDKDAHHPLRSSTTATSSTTGGRSSESTSSTKAHAGSEAGGSNSKTSAPNAKNPATPSAINTAKANGVANGSSNGGGGGGGGGGSSSIESGGTIVNGDNFEPHTPSRRSVRFDVGAAEEEDDGLGSSDEDGVGHGGQQGQSQRLAVLLRSLWLGGSAAAAGVEA